MMVYFHAGEFEMGAANDLENDWPYDSDPSAPSALLKRGVVLVTLNYRYKSRLHCPPPADSTLMSHLDAGAATPHF